MDLFADVIPHGTSATTGEVVDLYAQAMEGAEEEVLPARTADDEAIMQAAREALGLGKGDWLTIDSEADLKKRLQERNHIVADLKTAQDHLNHVQKQLNAWNHLFEKQCIAWYELNPPKGGKKTYSCEFGKISARTVPAAYAIDDESKLQEFLKSQPERHAAWGCKPITTLSRNIDAVKKTYMDEYKQQLEAWQKEKPAEKDKLPDWYAKKPKPFIPLGLKFTDTHESFSIKHGE